MHINKYDYIANFRFGKTTLVNLLFKFYSPEQGRILIDGKIIYFERYGYDLCNRKWKDCG